MGRVIMGDHIPCRSAKMGRVIMGDHVPCRSAKMARVVMGTKSLVVVLKWSV